MLIRTRQISLPESEVTDEAIFHSRRKLLKGLVGAAALPLIAAAGPITASERTLLRADSGVKAPDWLRPSLNAAIPGEWTTDEKVTPFEYVARYNNFYEFGTGKSDPADNARDFRTDPWRVRVDGEADVTGTFDLEDLVSPLQLEERIYRFRCVEAWSMVVPWIGFPLSTLIKRFRPNSRAKYVRFETLVDPGQMPGQRAYFKTIDYPYVEGLRMDEAMHDLSFIAVGLYGDALPPQNGAPLRLVVPWKYGFKSIKSIVRISFVERRPR
ncbi:MAG: protein-methionine-sulfoxide reductase catalytic subunit MsrP, partial [Anaerolineae bacterium]|nr:protein-methionine-sulfoxide reductase catalytic subunit MsrP [Anaerolineae bacterium]